MKTCSIYSVEPRFETATVTQKIPEPVGVVGRVCRLLCFWKDFVVGVVCTGWGGREGGREGVPWRKAVEREEDGVGRKEGGGVCG